MGEEVFEIFDADNVLRGRSPRSEVHRDGLYHRAVHVLLFNSKQELLVQKRAPDKDVCPDRWDLSAAEHHQPGETGSEAAARGLREELGITPSQLPQLSLWRPSRLQHFEAPELNISDREFVETFVGTYDGIVEPDGIEVVDIGFWPREMALDILLHETALLTPWFEAELHHLKKKAAW